MLHKSKWVRHQQKLLRKTWTENGQAFTIVVDMRFDDECGNGHNTFSITGSIFEGGEFVSGGCIHEDIVKHFPDLARFIKWHLTSTDGPMHYIANTCYLAGTKDCHGLEKGEFRQFVNKDGLKNWEWVDDEPFDHDVWEATCPQRRVAGHWQACGRTGEGKERQLDAARACAVWPDATDAELSTDAETLTARLKKRLPDLMREFKAAMEELGFTY